MLSLGEIAYNAYCESTGGKSLITGDKLPEFKYLAEDIKVAWNRAASAVAEFVTEGN